jgi:uncharacterized protein (TIGR00251 family)
MLEKYQKTLEKTGEIYLRIRVRPGAGESAVRGILADETIKVDIAAPAENSRANRELIKFFCRAFSAAAADVKILSGAGGRLKLLKISKGSKK